MKKIAFFVSFLMVAASAAFADDFTSKLEVQLLSGVDIPTSYQFARHSTYGYNFGVGIGYRVDDQISVMAILESHNVSANFATDDYYYNDQVVSNELGLEVKYMLPTGPVRPYVFVGSGVSFLTYNEHYYDGYFYDYYSSGFLVDGGVGVNLPVDDQLSVFAQTKASFVWWDKNVANYWGLDKQLAYVPIQVGVDFHI